MNEYETSDLALAAFLLMRDMVLIRADKLPSGKFRFIFNDPDDEAVVLSMSFINSDFVKFDNHVRNLKKLVHRK